MTRGSIGNHWRSRTVVVVVVVSPYPPIFYSTTPLPTAAVVLSATTVIAQEQSCIVLLFPEFFGDCEGFEGMGPKGKNTQGPEREVVGKRQHVSSPPFDILLYTPSVSRLAHKFARN